MPSSSSMTTAATLQSFVPSGVQSTSPAARTEISALRELRRLKLPLAHVEQREPRAKGLLPEIVVHTGSIAGSLALSLPQELGIDVHEALFKALDHLTLPLPCIANNWAVNVLTSLSNARGALRSTAAAEGVQVCVVWEVQRAVISAGAVTQWRRPFLPTDLQQRHRWMDIDLLTKHPLLDPHVDWHSAVEPPVLMLTIWRPAGQWQIVTDSETDREGWQYAPGWNSRTWHASPRPLFDGVRRRRWERRFQLGSSHQQDQLVDSSWLQARPRSVRHACQLLCCCCRRRQRQRPASHRDSNV